MKEERIRINRTDNENWMESWKEGIGLFLEEIGSLETISKFSGTEVEQYLEMERIKQKYNLIELPEGALSSIFKKRLTEMKGVSMKETDGKLILSADTIEITLEPGWNQCIYAEDKEKYKIGPYYHFPIRMPYEPYNLYAEAYLEHKNGTISRWTLRKRYAQYQKKYLEEKNVRISALRLFRNSFIDAYRNNERMDEYLEMILKETEKKKEAEIQKKKNEESNQKRLEKRKRVLKESGLKKLLEEFRDAGVEIQSKGMIQEKDWI